MADMKIKLVVFFVLLFGVSSFYGQHDENDLGKSLVHTVMDMWTKIDIVRAINTDYDQKNIFLEDLINDSFEGYYISRQIKRAAVISNARFDQDLIDLIATVRKSFEEVFCPVNNADFYVFCYVLQKIVNVLKIPEHIEPHIAT